MDDSAYEHGVPLTADGVFELVTDEAYRDGVIEPGEEKLLKGLASALRIPRERAKVLSRRSKERFRKGQLGPRRRFDSRLLYARVMRYALSDGHVDVFEKAMVRGLFKLFKLTPEDHAAILAEVQEAPDRTQNVLSARSRTGDPVPAPPGPASPPPGGTAAPRTTTSPSATPPPAIPASPPVVPQPADAAPPVARPPPSRTTPPADTARPAGAAPPVASRPARGAWGLVMDAVLLGVIVVVNLAVIFVTGSHEVPDEADQFALAVGRSAEPSSAPATSPAPDTSPTPSPTPVSSPTPEPSSAPLASPTPGAPPDAPPASAPASPAPPSAGTAPPASAPASPAPPSAETAPPASAPASSAPTPPETGGALVLPGTAVASPTPPEIAAPPSGSLDGARALLSRPGGEEEAYQMLANLPGEDRANAEFHLLLARASHLTGRDEAAAIALVTFVPLAGEPPELAPVRKRLEQAAAAAKEEARAHLRARDGAKAAERYRFALLCDPGMVAHGDVTLEKLVRRRLAAAGKGAGRSPEDEFRDGYLLYLLGDLEAATRLLKEVAARETDPYRLWRATLWADFVGRELDSDSRTVPLGAVGDWSAWLSHGQGKAWVIRGEVDLVNEFFGGQGSRREDEARQAIASALKQEVRYGSQMLIVLAPARDSGAEGAIEIRSVEWNPGRTAITVRWGFTTGSPGGRALIAIVDRVDAPVEFDPPLGDVHVTPDSLAGSEIPVPTPIPVVPVYTPWQPKHTPTPVPTPTPRRQFKFYVDPATGKRYYREVWE